MKKVERRIVSVLFADLVGFTTMSEQLHPEDVALIQDHYFQRVKDTIDSYGGLIEKFIGDAAVAVFGLPVAHEDDAERAVRAALEIVRSVQQICAELGIASDVLDVRVGVNTGEVIFSQMDENLNDWRVTGDVVNVAARLQSEGRPGSVLVGAGTALSVEAAIEVQQAGEFNLKGKTEPIQAWWVIAPRIEPSRRYALGALRATTVGRDAELAVLRQLVERLPGHAELWVIVAPPGVGKSHLIDVFSRELNHRGNARLWVTRIRSESAFGYEPIRDLLRSAFEGAGIPLETRSAAEKLLEVRLTETSRTGLHAQVVIEHTMTLAWQEDLSMIEDDRDTLFTSWVTALEVLSENQPSVWILDDLHWANPDMLAFLEYSAEYPTATGRLILTTARSIFLEMASHWFAPDSDIKILHLENLKETEANMMITALLGEGVLPHDLEQQIVASSDGNPLFVEELIRSWVSQGILVLDEDEQWALKGSDQELEFPTSVQAIYSAQLDTLPPLARQVACLGSIGGRRFPIAALEAMGVDEPQTAISVLVKRQFFSGPHPDPFLGESFAYRHALLKDVAYGSLPRSDRARLHVRFAKWLEQQPSCLQLACELVGNHYSDALKNTSTLMDNVGEGLSRPEVSSLAATWLERAAKQALTSAPQSSTTLFIRCLGLTPEDSLSDRLRLSQHLGEAFRRSGDLESAMMTFESSAIQSIAAQDQKTLVAAAIGYEDALFASRLPRSKWGDKSTSLLTAALEALSGEETGVRARTLASLGRSQIYGSAPKDGVTHSIGAVEMARRTEDSSALAYALLALRSSHLAPESLPQRLQEVTELVLAARSGGDKEMELEGQRLRLLDLLERGEIEEARKVCKQAVSLIEELRRPMYFWYPPMWGSMFALFMGTFKEAEAKIQYFREEGERWNYRDFDLVYGVQFFQLHKDRGYPERARETIEKIGAKFESPAWSPILGLLYAELGMRKKARIQFDVYAPTFTDVPSNLSWSYIMALLCEICAYLQDRKTAETIYGLLSPWANHNIVLGSGALCLGSASYFLGLAARTMDDFPTAIEHFRAAVGMNKQMGSLPAELRSRLELARTHKMEGGEAEEQLRNVIDLARNIGMDGIVKEGMEILS
jgi:class 3 adenylate cyclase/tetratricopeptide (TPR) repeat protein